ncbi:GNAT family N-acetyltransferase [Streptomyces pactum]|uniref:GNAT family N-acetyltransferase n=1 Tax=Streptomyces pactum TaxID=68249 RepID=A0A1S6JIJ6_9ACTN|nr:GNAT family N-acetyltransferase [Streptomyces pactum]AQS65676.1 GNAT family N-acetyltransferase [Streptomyces pactum]AQS71580.1 GNAT family N-acetyltransferase [Streptomyces pactum]
MNWKTDRVEGAALDPAEVLAVYHASGLAERRPVEDPERFAAMVANANLVLAARDEEGTLLGIVRAMSDFSYVTYVCDIAVVRERQRSGIGRALIDATREAAPAAKLVLLSAPAAVDYYPHIGFTRHASAWVLNP